MSRYHRQDCIGKYLKAINVNKTIFVVISEHDHYTSFIVSGVSWWNVHNKSYKGIEFLSSIIHFESKKRGDLSEIKYTDKIQISLFAFWLFIFTFFREALQWKWNLCSVQSSASERKVCLCVVGLAQWKLTLVGRSRPVKAYAWPVYGLCWKTNEGMEDCLLGSRSRENQWGRPLGFEFLPSYLWREKIFVSQHAEVLLSVKGKPD